MRTRLDAQLGRRAAVRRQAGRRARKHVGILAAQRGKVGGIAVVRGQRKSRPVGGEPKTDDESTVLLQRSDGRAQ